MDNIKVLLTCIFITGCVTLSLSSCSSKGENEETAYVNAEYLDSLNKTINDYSASTQEQRETLFRIMKELDEIADEAFALGKERQLKGQVADMKMVDKVKYKAPSLLSGAFAVKAIKTAGPLCAVGIMVCMVMLIISRRKEEKSRARKNG